VDGRVGARLVEGHGRVGERFKFIAMRGERLKRRRALFRSLRLEMTMDEDDMPVVGRAVSGSAPNDGCRKEGLSECATS
jgi:hypothetical protein